MGFRNEERSMAEVKPHGSYGIDAPWVPWMWLGYTALYIVLTIFAATSWHSWPVVVVLLAVLAVGFAACAALYWYVSLRGKFVLWDRLLAGIDVPSGATVLDLGCGHGMVSVMTAVRFPGCSVVGIDLWRSIDQSGNSAAAAERNAAVNGVGGRVRFDTGDMTRLPYPDASFQLVTASLAIHNIPSRDGRRQAIAEAVRVLAPGGMILIADIQRTKGYADGLRAAGFDVERTPLGWRGWWSGPWMATSVVTATAPGARR
jgi:arsenite methyltransferase